MSLFHPPRATPASDEEENPYLLSFSDILASLLAIFILALVAVMIRLDQQTSLARDTRMQVQQALAELARIEGLRRELLEEVKKNLTAHQVHVEITDNHSVLRIPDSQLHFQSGEYQIAADQRQTVDVIGLVLTEALQHAKRLQFIDTIFIEGHTDSQPLSYQAMGNWGLSTDRAIALWLYWTDNPGRLHGLREMRNQLGKPLFSVSGYADTRRLVVPDLTPQERQRNRRIDLRFTMRTPVTGDLMTLLETFKQAGVQPQADKRP